MASDNLIDVKYRLLVGIDAEDNTKDELLAMYLEQARKKVIKTRHPYGSTESQKNKAIEDYSDNVEQIYVYLYNKIGAEGQTSHNENGISRGYESAGIPSSFTDDIIPFVGMF